MAWMLASARTNLPGPTTRIEVTGPKSKGRFGGCFGHLPRLEARPLASGCGCWRSRPNVAKVELEWFGRRLVGRQG